MLGLCLSVMKSPNLFLYWRYGFSLQSQNRICGVLLYTPLNKIQIDLVELMINSEVLLSNSD